MFSGCLRPFFRLARCTRKTPNPCRPPSTSSSAAVAVWLAFRRCYCEFGSRASVEEDVREGKSKTKRPRLERKFEELTVDTFGELIKSKEDEELIKSILEDYEYLKYTTERVPSIFTAQLMARVMKEAPGPNQREQFFRYLFKREIAKLSGKRKQAERLKEKETLFADGAPVNGIHYDSETGAPIYGLWKNSLLLHVGSAILGRVGERNLLEAAFFGQPVVMDFGLTDKMARRDVSSMVEQVLDAYSFNKASRSAFDLWFCNYDYSSVCGNKLDSHNAGSPGTLIHIEEKSYLDIFPREKLVYLTPDARETLIEVNPDDIYVIGALNDRSPVLKDLCMSKAKSEGIRHKRFPLAEHLFLHGSPCLTIDQTMKILVTYKETRDWEQALKWVPRRKIKSPERVKQEQEYRESKFLAKKMKRFSLYSRDEEPKWARF